MNQDDVDKVFSELLEWNTKLKTKEIQCWDMKFQNLWTQINSLGSNLVEIKKLSRNLIEHVGNFRHTAELVMMKIID